MTLRCDGSARTQGSSLPFAYLLSLTPPARSVYLHQKNLTANLAGSVTFSWVASPSIWFTVPSALQWVKNKNQKTWTHEKPQIKEKQDLWHQQSWWPTLQFLGRRFLKTGWVLIPFPPLCFLAVSETEQRKTAFGWEESTIAMPQDWIICEALVFQHCFLECM